jgi:dCTP diphosphatase
MCHAFRFDPSEVILEKLATNEKKYPVERAKGRPEKYTET